MDDVLTLQRETGVKDLKQEIKRKLYIIIDWTK